MVKATVLTWRDLLLGDDTGELLVSFPPNFTDVPKVGEIVILEGMLSESGVMTCYRFNYEEERIAVVETRPMETQPKTPVVTQQPTTELQPVVPQPEPQPEILTPQKPEVNVKCPVCGRVFKNEMGLKVHMKLAHGEAKAEEKKVVPVTPQQVTPILEQIPSAQTTTPPPQPAEAKPQLPEELIRLARIAGMINKPYEDFKKAILKDHPNIDVDELIRQAGCVVEGGVV